MTKYRKGQQRTAKDHKGPTKDPQRTAKEHYGLKSRNNNNNDRLTASDPGQPG